MRKKLTSESGNAIQQMGVLIGDVSASGMLTNADVSLVKAQVAAGTTVIWRKPL